MHQVSRSILASVRHLPAIYRKNVALTVWLENFRRLVVRDELNSTIVLPFLKVAFLPITLQQLQNHFYLIWSPQGATPNDWPHEAPKKQHSISDMRAEDCGDRHDNQQRIHRQPHHLKRSP